MQDGGGDDVLTMMFTEGDRAIETEEAINTFEGTYRKSIAHVFSLLQDLIGRSV